MTAPIVRETVNARTMVASNGKSSSPLVVLEGCGSTNTRM